MPIHEAALHRSRRHRMVAGVIGGIAEYFDKDPTLLRVLYVLLSVVSAAFPGLFIYILLWIIIRSVMRPGSMRSMLLALLVAGCSSVGLHESVSGGLLEGTVRSSQGEPVVGAMITAVARQSPFGPSVAEDSAWTDAAGQFRIPLASSEVVDADALVTIKVRPPANSPLVGADTSAVAVRFSPASPSTDTTRVSFRLSYLPD